ncbi:MAG: sugar ABC transporter substrate-binding protein [Aggregatilineales bacterium]
MSRKTLFVVLMMALFVTPMVAVNAQDDASSVVGVLIPTTNGDFYDGLTESLQEFAADFGLEVVILSAENDLETESANLASLIEQGVSALLFSPMDAVASLPIIAEANAAGIPVFVLSSDLDLTDAEVEVVSTIGMDNAVAATTAAEYLCTTLEETGTVIELYNVDAMMDEMETEEDADASEDMEAMEAHSAADVRSEAFNAYFAESCTGVTVSQLDISGLADTEAATTIRGALSDEVNAIFATNDADILNAMSATIRARRNNITLLGFNATEDTLGAIEIGRLTGTISPSGTQLASVGLSTVASYLAGETVENTYALDPLVINAEAIEAVRNCPPNFRCGN